MKNLFTHAAEAEYTPNGLLEGQEPVFAETHTGLARAALREHPEYQKRVRQLKHTFDTVCDELGDDNRHLMHQLEDLQNSIEPAREDPINLQGYLDCVALLCLIKMT